MGIKIRHGGPTGSAVGQIIAQAGQANLERQAGMQRLVMQLRAQQQMRQQAQKAAGRRQAQALVVRQQMQDKSIQAAADHQKQSAKDASARDVIRSGLDRELYEMEVENKRAELEQRAKIEAEQVDYKIGAVGKAEIAKHNRNEAALKQAHKDNVINDEELEAQLLNNRLDVKPEPFAAEPKPPTLVEQREIDEDGNVLFPSSSGVRLAQSHDKTPKGMQIIWEREQITDHAKARRDYSTNLIDLKEKEGEFGAPTSLDPLEIQRRLGVWDAINPSPQFGGGGAASSAGPVAADAGIQYDPSADPRSGMHPDSIWAARARAGQLSEETMREARGEPAAPATPVSEQEEQVRLPSKVKVGKTNIDLKLNNEEKEMPQQIGARLAMFRAISEKYEFRSQMPPMVRKLYDELEPIVEEVYGQK
jgi:hypothetical protein